MGGEDVGDVGEFGEFGEFGDVKQDFGPLKENIEIGPKGCPKRGYKKGVVEGRWTFWG